MHDIWNPWHGCKKCSEGCENCYMYFLDRMRDRDGSQVSRTQNFDYPLQRTRGKGFKIKSGELIRVCMTSDFFLEEADGCGKEATSDSSFSPNAQRGYYPAFPIGGATGSKT